MAKIQLATPEQRAEYQQTKPVYPLHGYITIKGVTCYVEDLRGYGDRDDPQWELVLPPRHHLEIEGLHTLLGFTQADLLERIRGEGVTPCAPGCDCGWDSDSDD